MFSMISIGKPQDSELKISSASIIAFEDFTGDGTQQLNERGGDSNKNGAISKKR